MLNVIAVMGRVCNDIELRKTTGGTSVCSFSIACQRNRKDKSGEYPTDFIDVVSYGSTAEFACNYFKKGQLVAVDGTLQTRSYETKEGQKRKVYEIVADNLHFAEKKQDGARPIQPAPQNTGDDDFEVVDDSEDLPF